MTSTSTPSDPLASILSRQGHTPLRSESDRSPQVGPARGRSRFPLAPVPAGSADGMHRALWRSEERRVGKECRSEGEGAFLQSHVETEGNVTGWAHLFIGVWSVSCVCREE